MTRRALCDFLVASCVSDGGVLRYRLYEDGNAEELSQQRIPMDRPMFFEERNGVLWTLLRAPFEGSAESGVVCVDLQSRETVRETISTGGEVGCHIAVCGEDAYVANYISGSLIRLGDTLVTHSGKSVHPTRQTSPHAHGAFLSPDARYVLVCDLGIDRILVYTRSLELVSVAHVPPGSGPRHLCFSSCGKYVYCVTEMGGSVCTFAWQNGVLTHLETVSLLPDGHVGDGAGAAIRLSADGSRLYATERATAKIVTLAVDGAHLTRIDSVDCAGREPRDFALIADGRVALCANQFSDTLAIFRVSADGKLTLWNTLSIDAPICVAETKIL